MLVHPVVAGCFGVMFSAHAMVKSLVRTTASGAAVCFLLTPAVIAQPLNAAIVRGSTVYDPTQLFATYQPHLGRDAVTSARAVLAGIESLYERDGYVRPRVDVFDDLLPDGILRIVINEVRLTDVVVKGDVGPYGERIESIAHGITSNLPLRSRIIPDAVGRLQALPGLQVSAKVLEKPGVPGAAVLQLETRYKPAAVNIEWSHRGTDEVGPDFYSVQVSGHNLLHRADRIGVFATTTRRPSEYYQVGGFMDLPLGGSLLSMGMSRSNSQPSFNGTQYELFYPQDSASAVLSRRMTARDGLNVSGAFGVGYTDAYIEYEGLDVEADRLRTAFLGISVEGMLGSAASYALSARWRRGFDILGGRIDFVDGSGLLPTYNVGTVAAALALPLGSRWRLRAGVSGQSSSRALPYVEQFKVGGAHLGRGLETAIMAGDSGAGGNLELRHFLPGTPAWLGKLALYGFSDYGTVWHRDGEPRQYVGTAGLGIAAEHSRFQLNLEAGRPVIYRDQRPAGTSLFGGASFRF
jgi:hemolysin activation/secretion protein